MKSFLLGNLAGKYLIPEGTKLFDFLIMSGAAAHNAGRCRSCDSKAFSKITESVKKFWNIILKDFTVTNRTYLDPLSNPNLKPGDMVIVPKLVMADPCFIIFRLPLHSSAH
ncbi:MAG: hypothetical protein R2942_11475 [Ignavibacteria bacterium]